MALAGLICGSRTPTGWTASKDKVDFYDIKGDLRGLLEHHRTVSRVYICRRQHPALHPGQSAALSRNGQKIGWVGQLHPKLQAAAGISVRRFTCFR